MDTIGRLHTWYPFLSIEGFSTVSVQIGNPNFSVRLGFYIVLLSFGQFI